MKQIKLILSLIILLGLISGSSSIYSVGGSLDNSSGNIKLNQTITNTTIWEDVFDTFTIDNSFTVSDTGNFTIINSHIIIDGVIDTDGPNSGDLQENGIVVSNGGTLIIRDSIIETIDNADHTIFGVSSGTVILDNATLSSLNGDASHFENNYNFEIDGSTFQNSGDDGFHVENNPNPIVMNNSFILNNGDDGFDIGFSNGEILLENSQVIGNYGDAIKIEDSGNITVRNTYVDYTGSTNPDNRGFDVRDSSLLHVEDSTITGFTSDGIKTQRTPAELYNVTVQNSGDEGLEFETITSEKAVILDHVNVINANGGDGIKVEGVTGEVLINNTKVINSNDDGIQITLGSTVVYVHNTLVTTAKEDGFELDGSTYFEMKNVNASYNTENGIKYKNIGNIVGINITAKGNGVSGIDIVNAASFNGENLTLSNNSGGGINAAQTSQISIQNSEFSVNRVSNGDSYGLFLDGISEFYLNNSEVSDNSGTGIVLSNTNGSLLYSQIHDNGRDGIQVVGRSNVTIAFNTISSNSRDGLSIFNGTSVLVRNNTFTGNGRYGVFADLGSGETVDLSDNYWGSDDGPVWQDNSQGAQDGVFGDITMSSILDSSGNSIGYTPPEEVNFQQILIIVLVILGIIGLVYFSYIIARREKWKQETQPLAIIYISQVGIPTHEYIFREGLVDSSLISGFLSATSSFGAEMIQNKDGTVTRRKIRELQQNENVIMIYFFEGSMIALIVENSNPLISSSLEEFGDAFILEASKLDGESLDSKVEQIDVSYFEKLVHQKFNDYLSKIE